MSFIPDANWAAILLGFIFFAWMQRRHETALSLANDAQDKLKGQLQDATERFRLFEYVIKENRISEQYNLSDGKHPEMYTEDKFDIFNRLFTPGWQSERKPKLEFEKEIELSRQLYVAEMGKLQHEYDDCLEPGKATEFTDKNFWLWFEPNFEHPYYAISHFVATGRNDWKPPERRK